MKKPVKNHAVKVRPPQADLAVEVDGKLVAALPTTLGLFFAVGGCTYAVLSGAGAIPYLLRVWFAAVVGFGIAKGYADVVKEHAGRLVRSA